VYRESIILYTHHTENGSWEEAGCYVSLAGVARSLHMKMALYTLFWSRGHNASLPHTHTDTHTERGPQCVAIEPGRKLQRDMCLHETLGAVLFK
jgi:hypothetical protein